MVVGDGAASSVLASRVGPPAPAPPFIPVHPTLPAAAVPAAAVAPTLPKLPPTAGWSPARGGFDNAKADKYLMHLSSPDLRVFMRVLDVVGKVGASIVFKRRAALEAMAREDISEVTLEALVDDHALNCSDTRPKTPRRTLRSLLPPRVSHQAHDGPPLVVESLKAGSACDALVGLAPSQQVPLRRRTWGALTRVVPPTSATGNALAATARARI